MLRIRLFFTGIILFFLIGAGVAQILSIQDIIPNSWASYLGTTFSILDVLIAFVQWLLPLSSSETKPSAESIKSSRVPEIFIKQIYDRLTGDNGALVVYEKIDNVGKSISAKRNSGNQVEQVKANIVERTVNGYPLFTAVFPGLKPDTYQVSGPTRDESITVFSEQVAEMDWRRDWWKEAAKAKRRQNTLDVLRVQSVMIGLGGVLFLANKYFLIPYLDTAGIILMALGVVNMLSTFVLNWLGWLEDVQGSIINGEVLYRRWVFVAELGGVLFFAHRYTTIPYLNIIGVILIGLGVGVLVFLILKEEWQLQFSDSKGAAVRKR